MTTHFATSTRKARTHSAAAVAVFVLIAASLVMTCAGCRFVTTKIGSIQAKPGEYLTREVTVAGNVTDSIKLPFLPGVYGVRDGSGEMKVLTNTQPPLSGARVRLQVRVEAAATIDGQAIGLHLVEIRRY